MKKIYFLGILMFLSLFIMVSCISNSGAYLIAGEFYSKENRYNKEYEDFNADYQNAILKIKKINKDTYLKANGLNVVNDASTNRVGNYYSIELLVFSKEKNDYIQLNYSNLSREPHMNAISYRDDGGFLFCPNEMRNQPNTSWKYTLSHKGYYGSFYLE